MQINPKNIIAIFCELTFVIIMAYLFSIVANDSVESTSIQIDNFTSNIKDLPNDASNLIAQELYQTVSLNTDTNFNLANSGAIIRQDSIIETQIADLNMNYLNFIIDVPDANQSYQVVYEWSPDKNNPYILPNNPLYVMCLPDSESCKDSYNGHGNDYVLYNILSYYPFDNFSVNPTLANDHLYLNINLPDGEPTTKNNALSTIKSFIKSLGFNSDNFEYNTEYRSAVNVH